MKNIQKHLAILGEINLADWITLSALIPIVLGYYFIINQQPELAIISAAIAFLLDLLDGYTARRLNLTSEFGKQLDTLVDVLNYLAFSAFFMIFFLNFNHAVTFLTVLMMLAAGILRLARYNVLGLIQEDQKDYYLGIPVPFVQLSTIALFLSTELISEKIIYLTPIVIGVVSLLMISTVRFKKPKNYLFLFGITMGIICLTLLSLQK